MKKTKNKAGRVLSLLLAMMMMITLLPVGEIAMADEALDSYYIYVLDGFDSIVPGVDVSITASLVNENPDAEPEYITDGDKPVKDMNIGVTNSLGQVNCKAVYDYLNQTVEEGKTLTPLNIELKLSKTGYENDLKETYVTSDVSSHNVTLRKILPVANCSAYNGDYDEKSHAVVEKITYESGFEPEESETDKVKYICKLNDAEKEETLEELDEITTVDDANKYEYIKVVVSRDKYADYVSDKLVPVINPVATNSDDYTVKFTDRTVTTDDTVNEINAVESVTGPDGLEVASDRITYYVKNSEGNYIDNKGMPLFRLNDLSEGGTEELTKDIKVVIKPVDNNHTEAQYTKTAKLKMADAPEFTAKCNGSTDDASYGEVEFFDGQSYDLMTISAPDGVNIANFTVSYEINGQASAGSSVNNAGIYDVKVTITRTGFKSKTLSGKVNLYRKINNILKVESMDITYSDEDKDGGFRPVAQSLFDPSSCISFDDSTGLSYDMFSYEYSKVLNETELSSAPESLEYTGDVPKGENAGVYKFYVKLSSDNSFVKDNNYSLPEYIMIETEIKKADITYSVNDSYEFDYNGSPISIVDMNSIIRNNTVNGSDLVKDSFSFKLTSYKDTQGTVDSTGKDYTENTIPEVTEAGEYNFTLNAQRSDNFNNYTKENIIVTVKSSQLNVECQNADVTMNKTNTYDISVSNKDIFKSVKTNTGLDVSNDCKVKYEIISGNGASINDKNILTYTETGTVKIRATFEKTNNYQETIKEYQINVKYLDSKAKVSVSGTKGRTLGEGEGKCDWYRGTTTLSPDMSPDWTIVELGSDGVAGFLKNANKDQVIKESISYTEEKVYKDYQYILLNKAGEICAPEKVAAFGIDTTAPSNVKFVLSEKNDKNGNVNNLKFGTFSNDKITVEVKYTDNISSVYSVQLMTAPSGGKYSAYGILTGLNGKSSSSFGVNCPFSGIMEAVVTDYAGNTVSVPLTTNNSNINKLNSKNFIMLEKLAPEATNVQLKVENVAEYVSSSGLKIYAGDPVFSFTAKDEKDGADKNSGIQRILVKVNESSDGNGKLLDKDYTDKKTTSENISVSCSARGSNADGSYKCSYEIIDNAGNSTISQNYTVYKDTTAPEITEFSFDGGILESDGKSISSVEATDYGFYFKQSVTVYVSAQDAPGANECASGVKSISFKAIDINGKVVINETKEADQTAAFVVPQNFKGQIYAYSTDNLGNTHYNATNGSGFVHPDGSIVENIDKHIETSAISISAPEKNGTENYTYTYGYKGSATQDKSMDYNAAQNVPLYNYNPTFNISVSDSFSGLKSASWSYISGNTIISSSSVTVGAKGNLTGSGWNVNGREKNLVTSLSTSVQISGNQNDLTLLVEIEDRAGNRSYDYYNFGIDKTAPQISVTYDNNSSDSTYRTYYKKPRKATIVITERNFNPAKVIASITNKDGAAPQISQWVTSSGVVSDLTTHTATIDYAADGDYSFAMSFTDNAGNKANDIAKQEFVVDTIVPVVTVSYDNNSCANDKYFNASRTATILVNEHNFAEERAKIVMTAKLDDQNVALPKYTWKTDGDKHTAIIAFSSDADYTFSVESADKSGNNSIETDYGKSAAPKDFVIDTVIEKPVIAGVQNEHSYADTVEPEASFADVNLDSYTYHLTRTRLREKDIDVSADYKNELTYTPAQGKKYSGSQVFENFEKAPTNDGIYKLTASITDLAGNKSEDAEVVFSVNRYGSVYVYSDYISDELIERQYVKKVDNELVITEYNPDKIVADDTHNISVTRDGEAVGDIDIKTSPVISDDVDVGESGWYQYEYTIPKKSFNKDGAYDIAVTSVDKAGNTTVSSLEAPIKFSVDSTKPELKIVKGLEDSTYNASSIKVNFDAFDAIAIKSVVVKVNDKQIKKFEDIEDLNECSDSFKIGEGVNQKVTIEIEDMASNKLNTDDKDFNCNYKFEKTVTVSTSFFVRWFANKPLFIGSIIGAFAAISLIVFLIFRKKRLK